MIPLLLGDTSWEPEPRVRPCPCCGGVLGDGDRVTKGICGMCQHKQRRR